MRKQAYIYWSSIYSCYSVLCIYVAIFAYFSVKKRLVNCENAVRKYGSSGEEAWGNGDRLCEV